MTTTTRAATALALVLGLVGCSASGTGATGVGGESPGASSTASLPAEPSAAPTEPASSPSPPETVPQVLDLDAELEALEEEFEATVGVSAVDTGSGRTVSHRDEELFGFASTIKLFAAAVMLRELPVEQRSKEITWTRDEVEAAGYAPYTAEHLGESRTLLELAEATVRTSDNLALNLVVRDIGGPEALTAGLRTLGDTATRVTVLEPQLNAPDLETGDNATTPGAFTAAVRTILEPGTLDPADLALLLEWTRDNATGANLVRAGAPDGWDVRDKSGGAGPMRNDVAIVTPPGGEAIVLTVLTRRNDPDARWSDELVARVAEVVLEAYAETAP